MTYKTRPHLPFFFLLPNPFKYYEVREDRLYTFYTPLGLSLLRIDGGYRSLSGADVVPHRGAIGYALNIGGMQISTANQKFDVHRLMDRNAFRSAVEGNPRSMGSKPVDKRQIENERMKDRAEEARARGRTDFGG